VPFSFVLCLSERKCSCVILAVYTFFEGVEAGSFTHYLKKIIRYVILLSLFIPYPGETSS
jgi:Na+/proline symporter